MDPHAGSEAAAPFVGRADGLATLATLAAEWTAVVGGASRICWIVGEPGMGKTALARRFTRKLDARWVIADEAEQVLRFGVAEQLLRAPVPPTATELDVGADLLLGLGGHDQPIAVVVDDLQWADPPSLGALRFALRRAWSRSTSVEGRRHRCTRARRARRRRTPR